MTPLLGLTQYCLGAVVFTLKMTVLFVGFFSFNSDVTTSEKGPREGDDGGRVGGYSCIADFRICHDSILHPVAWIMSMFVQMSIHNIYIWQYAKLMICFRMHLQYEK